MICVFLQAHQVSNGMAQAGDGGFNCYSDLAGSVLVPLRRDTADDTECQSYVKKQIEVLEKMLDAEAKPKKTAPAKKQASVAVRPCALAERN